MVSKLRLSILSLFLCFNQLVTAQDAGLADSLKRKLTDRELTDSSRFEILRVLSQQESSIANAVAYSFEALEVATKQGSDLNQARAYESIGGNERVRGNLVSAVFYLRKADSIYVNKNMQQRSAALSIQLADVYTVEEDFQNAALEYKKAIGTFDASQDIKKAIVARVNLSESLRKDGLFDESKDVLIEALELNEETEIPIFEAYARGNLGMVYHAQGQIAQGKTELEKAVRILETLRDHYAIATYSSEIGQIMIKQGQKDEGFQKVEEALSLARSEGLKEQVRDISLQLSNLYADHDQYLKAYLHQQMYQAYKDSIINPDNIRMIEQTLAQHKLDQVEQQRVLTQKQRDNARIVGALVLTLAIIVLIAYMQKQRSNRELKHKNDIIATQMKEKELLHREMHHRVKNNLQLISSIMGLQARSSADDAVYHALSTGRSRMEAMTLIHQSLYMENSNAQVDLHDYLHRLGTYLHSTFDEGVDQLSVESDHVWVKADDSIPIGLIINEAVCNAVKYRGDQKVSLEIQFGSIYGQYLLLIKDNGPGLAATVSRQENMLDFSENTGFGTQLMKTLATQVRAELDIDSSSQGTTITLALKELSVLTSEPHEAMTA